MKRMLKSLNGKLKQLKSKLNSLKNKIPSFDEDCPARKTLSALLLLGLTTYTLLNASDIHKKLIRAMVSPHVYKIVAHPAVVGGGTGFSISAPSGANYIVTNSHVCLAVLGLAKEIEAELAPNSLLVVDNEGFAMERRIIAISGLSDLCLIEGVPNDKGLSIGTEADIGDIITSFGHPLLEPLTTSSGEVIAETDVTIFNYALKTGDPYLDAYIRASDGKCDLPKNQIVEQKILSYDPKTDTVSAVTIKLCLTVTRGAHQTNMTIFPGNSGSPVVDKLGRVVGVVFAADTRTNYGFVVSLKDLQDFIARY